MVDLNSPSALRADVVLAALVMRFVRRGCGADTGSEAAAGEMITGI